MIIKLIPETKQERENMSEVVHEGVGSFFLCGIDRDEEGDASYFHDWHGEYRFLIGNLSYYLELIKDEMIKKGNIPPVRDFELNSKDANNQGHMVKRGQVQQPQLSVLEPEDIEVTPQVGFDLKQDDQEKQEEE